MKKKIVTVALLASAAFGGMLLGQTAGLQSRQQVTSLGIAYIEMGPEFISRDGRWLMAFVPSGSTEGTKGTGVLF